MSVWFHFYLQSLFAGERGMLSGHIPKVLDRTQISPLCDCFYTLLFVFSLFSFCATANTNVTAMCGVNTVYLSLRL